MRPSASDFVRPRLSIDTPSVPKQIALRENFVLALPGVADRYLYYQTDTTPGSSGSTVFNENSRSAL